MLGIQVVRAARRQRAPEPAAAWMWRRENGQSPFQPSRRMTDVPQTFPDVTGVQGAPEFPTRTLVSPSPTLTLDMLRV
jgi:hypothetical protein